LYEITLFYSCRVTQQAYQMFIISQNDEMLLAALSRGDSAAFIEIYNLYWYRVFSVAYKRIRNKEIAKELTQDLFLKLWEKRETLKPQKIENYLFVAIKNAVIDHIDSGLVEGKYLDHYKAFGETNCNTTQNIVAFEDLSGTIEKGLAELPAKSQQVFRLGRLDNWSTNEIAQHLNLSEKTVGYHLTKSLKFMRSYLREYLL
jgi:RNA polymerase sigma-70 factor (family 1)